MSGTYSEVVLEMLIKNGRKTETEQFMEHATVIMSCGKGLDDEINRAINRVTVNFFNFNSVHSIIITK